MNALIKSKTFWAAITSIIGVVAAWQTGQMTGAMAAQTAIGAIIAVFLRHGMATTDAKVDQVVKVQTLNTPVAAAIAQADTKIVAAGGVGTISPPDVPAK